MEARIFPETEVLKKILEETELKWGDKILDVGSGTGIPIIFLSRFVSPNGQAFGVDTADAMIKQAEQNARELGANVEFKKAEAKKLPFKDYSMK